MWYWYVLGAFVAIMIIGNIAAAQQEKKRARQKAYNRWLSEFHGFL